MIIRLTRRGALALGSGTLMAAVLGRPALAAASEIRIGWQKGGVVALLKGTGLLEERLAPQGVTVSWSEFSSGPPLLEALAAGALDFGHTGDVPPLFAHSAGGDIVFVGYYEGSAAGSAILVREGSGIETLADLKGRSLAFKRGSSAHNVALQLLRTAGLTLDDVTQVDLAPPDAAPAFQSGAVDAWSIWDPYTAIAEAEAGVKVLATADGVLPAINFFSASRPFAESNGPLIVTLIETLREVGQGAQADLDATVAAFAESTGVDPNVLRVVAARPGNDYGNLGFIGPEQIAYEQNLADDFLDQGIIPGPLDIASKVWTPETAS
jgi:sulfonate transport system substrate-binding protein